MYSFNPIPPPSVSEKFQIEMKWTFSNIIFLKE